MAAVKRLLGWIAPRLAWLPAPWISLSDTEAEQVRIAARVASLERRMWALEAKVGATTAPPDPEGPSAAMPPPRL